MKHKKVVEAWYQVDFNASHRTLGNKIDEFLKDSPEFDIDPDLADEKWQGSHTILNDYEGDFSGIFIYSNDDTAPLIKFICKKLEIDYDDVKKLDFKLIG